MVLYKKQFLGGVHLEQTNVILETPRLLLREMTQKDFPSLCTYLQDPAVMYAYEHAFSNEEVQQWLDRQRTRYRELGFGPWAVILKETQQMIGQCGLSMQETGDNMVPEIGYLFAKAYWHQGYATEAAQACKQYAFDVLQLDAVYSIIRETNEASMRVARRNGMQPVGRFVKHYYGMDMPHILFCVCNPNVTITSKTLDKDNAGSSRS